MSEIRETDLPGIGRKFQVKARSGDKLVIVVHDDGRRELYHFDGADPDDAISMVTLDDSEARQIASIIGGMAYRPQTLETAEIELNDLVIEWYKVGSGAAVVGRTIGEVGIRERTGATIIAVVENDQTKRINPGPEQVIREGVTLVVAGERGQIKALHKLVSGGRA